jgi:hypothetical protein
MPTAVATSDATPSVNGMYFRGKSWVDRLLPVQRGDHLTIQGRIREIHSFGIDVDECELID